MKFTFSLMGFALLCVSSAGCADTPTIPHVTIPATLSTEAVSTDADDPALWVHPTDPARSLIIGTNKTTAPEGGLAVFGLDGKIRQVVSNLDRPNNVDVEYGLVLNGQRVDIAVATERLQKRLRVWGIDRETGQLSDLTPQGLPVFEGQSGESAAPMGIGLYKRPGDGAIFAIVGRKTGPRQGYLWQYQLQDNGQGKLQANKVRDFGSFSGEGEIEAILVDDALGHVYYADEGNGIHKWAADPDSSQANQELAHFGRSSFHGDREGIALYARPDGTGYLICTDQRKDASEYHVFKREGEATNPHDHSRELLLIRGDADETDGLEISSTPLGADFPHGIMIAMNSAGRNFRIWDWRAIEAKWPAKP